ncbi:hypothetical protein JCM10212_000508 [Sporobolomyces blumeae]
MPHHGPDPLEIALESSDLVLRGFTGDEFDPAVLNGEVVLNLTHATDLREVSLVFTGTAKVTWRDTSTHHHDHPLFFHDFNFLNPSSHSAPHQGKKEHHHVHTLKPGRHVFPFSLHVPGSLPASLRTYSGTGVIEYKLKARAERPGITAADWKARRVVRIARGFGVDAVEYNQTLEIENTWPGKVMYSFTLPHKAFAAGDTIPVAVKFSPLAKGVRIVSLITTIREHTTVYSKSSSHSEARDATVVKYNFVEGGNGGGAETNAGNPPARIESTASLRSLGGFHASGAMTPTTPAFGSPFHGGAMTPLESPRGGSPRNGSPGFPFNRRPTGQGRFHFGADDEESEEEEEQPTPNQEPEQEEDDGQDTEVDVVVDVQVPIWTAPTHTVHPVFVNHKIKWSAFIKNPDGHVSELRCALPIHILAPILSEEARLASQGSRNLLFGESGVLARSDVPQVDLPSYQDHVMDRVANAETASYFSLASGFTPTPWSTRTTPTTTPGVSPPASRAPSRPPSPERRPSHGHGFHGLGGFHALSSINRHSERDRDNSSRRSSGAATPHTPATTSPPPERSEHPEDHRNWFDSELLSTLALSDHASPPNSNPSSRPGSRPGSRPSSRPSSRPPSRPASPDRSHASAAPSTPGAMPMSPGPSAGHHEPPQLSRSNTGGSFFNLHLPKPLRPLTAFSRSNSSSNVRDSLHMSGTDSGSRRGSTHERHAHFDEHQPSPSALSNALAAHAARSSSSNGRHERPNLNIDSTITHNLMSNSPSHPSSQNASSGPSPISSSPAAGFHQNPYATLQPSTPGGSSSSGMPSPSPRLPTPGGGAVGFHDAEQSNVGSDVDFLSQVPSYDVAARGFLGGGVVPISQGLPNYDDVEAEERAEGAEFATRSTDQTVTGESQGVTGRDFS